MARGGKLNVNIDDVRLADGEKAPLRAVKETQGGGHTGAMTGRLIGTAIVFSPPPTSVATSRFQKALRLLLTSTETFRLTRKDLPRKRQQS